MTTQHTPTPRSDLNDDQTCKPAAPQVMRDQLYDSAAFILSERDELRRQLARLNAVAVGRLNRIMTLEDALLDLLAHIGSGKYDDNTVGFARHALPLADVIAAARAALAKAEG